MKSKLKTKSKKPTKSKVLKGNKFAKTPTKPGRSAKVGIKSDKPKTNKPLKKTDKKTEAVKKTVKTAAKSISGKATPKVVSKKNTSPTKKPEIKSPNAVTQSTKPFSIKPKRNTLKSKTIPTPPLASKAGTEIKRNKSVAPKTIVTKSAAAKKAVKEIPKATMATITNQRQAPEEVALEELSISLIQPGKAKEKIWRTKNFAQFPAQKDFGFPDFIPELPTEYNETKLILMPKDPEYMFCYWEITPELLVAKESEKAKSGSYRETLKINWESKSLFEPNFTFIPVFFWARKWYFGVPQVGQRYQVELGWLSDSGHFISLVGSNLSELPENWTTTQKRLSELGDVLAYSSKHTQTLGSSENISVEDYRAVTPEWNLSSESMTSSSWSRGMSQPSSEESLPAKSITGNRLIAAKPRLEVSGKVFKGSRVTVDGVSLRIDSKGYFQHEFIYEKEILALDVVSATGARRTLTYDLKELILS